MRKRDRMYKLSCKAATKIVYIYKGKRYYNAKDVGETLGVCKEQIYKYVRNNTLIDGQRIRKTKELVE